MNKEFVEYNEALQLKELGFDEPCLAWHYPKLGTIEIGAINKNSDEWLMGRNCTAPLYQQAFRWFREKHQMHHQIIIRDLDKYKEGNPDFQLMIYTNTPVTLHKLKNCKAYEEAELECLKQLIKIVKKKNNG